MKKLFFSLFAFVCLSNFLIAQIPTNGLVSYYPFNGNANDSSGRGNNGTVYGETLTTDRFGNCGQAYKFNGINNFIEVPNSADNNIINSDFTVSFWMKTYGNDTMGGVIGKNYYGQWNGYFFMTNDNNTGYCTAYKHAYFYVAAGYQQDVCSDSAICKDTTWHFLTGVYNYSANLAKLYVDGVLQSTTGTSSGSTSNSDPLYIGGNFSDNAFYYNGVLDAIRIYQRALSDTEVVQLYNEPNPAYGSNCTPVAACNKSFTYAVDTAGQVNFTSDSTVTLSSWSFGDGSTSTSLNPSHTYVSNGVYTVQENVIDSLNNILCSTTQTISITNVACSAPAAYASYIIVADSVPHWWDIYVNYSQSVVNAIWYWGDGTSSSGLFPSHAYDSAGVYAICVTAYNSCGDSTTYCNSDSIYRLSNHANSNSLMTNVNVISNTQTGINKLSITNNQIKVYPNPSNGAFVVEPTTNTQQTITLYDINGNSVFSQSINGKTTIDVSNLNASIYNLSILSEGGIVNKRVVIVK